jgi:hypothetical protein
MSLIGLETALIKCIIQNLRSRMGNSSDAVVLRQIRIDREQYSYHHEMNHPLFGRCRYFHCNESNQWLSSKLLQFSNRDESSLVLLRLH